MYYRREEDPEREAFGQYPAFASPIGGFMLRKGCYKYHYYVSCPPELPDLAVGPVELHDLAPDPAHRETLDKWKHCRVPGSIPKTWTDKPRKRRRR